jgi:hypothetical protein
MTSIRIAKLPFQYKLEEHINIVHTEERAYKCERDMCGKTFSIKKSFTRYINGHKWRENNIRFKCDQYQTRLLSQTH